MKALSKASSIKRVVCVMKMEELLGNFWGLLGKTLGRILKERLFEKSFWGLFERVFEEDFVKC